MGHKHSEETKRKISKGVKGNLPKTAFKKYQKCWWKGNTIYERTNRITINGKVVYEHRNIYETTYGEIPKGYIIHHIDGDTKNNNISNLQLMKQSEHIKLHMNKFKENIKSQM
jgi:hypothetical protein